MRSYPLKFYEILKPKIWGGRRIEAVLGKPLPGGALIGESWELCDHFDDIGVVRNGALEGHRLRDVWQESPQAILGNALADAGWREFPLLVKFIDACETLSVQVHPDANYAAARDERGESGKNESWYIIHAEPDASLVAGLLPGVTRADFSRLLVEGRVEEALARLPVKAGDVIHIASGTVHAVGAGILLCEIQQTSDATYRLWDWGRLDNSGVPRPLHIDHALNCIDFKRGPISALKPAVKCSHPLSIETLNESEFFVIERLVAGSRVPLDSIKGRFSILVCLEGSGSLVADGERIAFRVGDTILIPAALETVTLDPEHKCTLLRTWIP